MYFARMSVWTFKKGKREEGLAKMDEMVSDAARTSEGYRGYVQLLSDEKADSATIITFWKDEGAREASSAGVFRDAGEAVKPYLEGQPAVSNFKVSDIELRI